MLIELGLQRKEKVLISLVIMYVMLANAISLMILADGDFSKFPPTRHSAASGTVPIIGNANTEDLGYIDDGIISLLWFARITDIHLSPGDDRTPAYELWLNWTYDIMHPFTVIVTGDLIAGQRPSNYSYAGEKVELEYANYWDIVKNSSYNSDPNPYRYLEIPGNHDINANWNQWLFLNSTISGNKHNATQIFFSANLSCGDVLFSLLDSTPYTSPPVIFGAEGNMDKVDLDEYQTFLEDNPKAEHKFTFHHQHPLECFGMDIKPGNNMFRTLMGLNREHHVDAAFYGHTHMQFHETIEDMAVIMGDKFSDTYESDRYGENTRWYYQIVSIDNSGMNFVDVPFTHLPNMIITNPSNPIFLDKHDPIGDTRGDGHIRALVFGDSEDPIINVEYRLDGSDWIPMALYKSSDILYESSRSSEPAIPNDGKEHLVEVRAKASSGKMMLQIAKVTYSPERKLFWEAILMGIIFFFLGVVIIQNRDNYPLKRADGQRQRLTNEQKVSKRVQRNKDLGRPWWMPILAWGAVLNFFFVPWGIFPIWQGQFVPVYAFFVAYPMHPMLLVEALLYCAGIILLGFAALYWGIRSFHPDGANFGGFTLFGNAIFIMVYVWDKYPGAPMMFPALYFYLFAGLAIMAGSFRKTYFGKIVTRLFLKSPKK